MERLLLCIAFFTVGTALAAQEHQRVGVSPAVAHRWETGLEGSFSPLGYAAWGLSLAPRIGYEWQKTWSASVSLPFSWRPEPETRTVKGTSGDVALGFNWAGGGNDFRWRLGWEGTFPGVLGSRNSPTTSLDLSLQAVRDPVILGVTGGFLPAIEGNPPSGLVTLFFQEVVNDVMTWGLVLSPRCTWFDGFPLWSLSVAWKVGWHEGGSSVSTGLSSGTLAPWTWVTSAAQTWDFP